MPACRRRPSTLAPRCLIPRSGRRRAARRARSRSRRRSRARPSLRRRLTAVYDGVRELADLVVAVAERLQVQVATLARLERRAGRRRARRARCGRCACASALRSPGPRARVARRARVPRGAWRRSARRARRASAASPRGWRPSQATRRPRSSSVMSSRRSRIAQAFWQASSIVCSGALTLRCDDAVQAVGVRA